MTFVVVVITLLLLLQLLLFLLYCVLHRTGSLLSLVFNYHVLLLLWREKVACNHQDWENFSKEKKISPPPQKRRPPTRDSQPQTPYRFKKRGCILRLTLIQHCHRKKITLALPVSDTYFTLPLHHVWDAETPPPPGHFALVHVALSPHGTSKSSR